MKEQLEKLASNLQKSCLDTRTIEYSSQFFHKKFKKCQNPGRTARRDYLQKALTYYNTQLSQMNETNHVPQELFNDIYNIAYFQNRPIGERCPRWWRQFMYATDEPLQQLYINSLFKIEHRIYNDFKHIDDKETLREYDAYFNKQHNSPPVSIMESFKALYNFSDQQSTDPKSLLDVSLLRKFYEENGIQDLQIVFDEETNQNVKKLSLFTESPLFKDKLFYRRTNPPSMKIEFPGTVFGLPIAVKRQNVKKRKKLQELRRFMLNVEPIAIDDLDYLDKSIDTDIDAKIRRKVQVWVRNKYALDDEGQFIRSKFCDRSADIVS
ncbi:BA75_00510T0 [Komagataella pastoris]|uniref:BA75_00510T0 n=1 Tax=Komagataella pastoris TaxID=4922 RepID=A0A1B2J8Q0_PICPA|nr:BA75_00510T0 [Komagataella pastoris]